MVQRGGWCLFFLAAVFPGVHLQISDDSFQPGWDSELPSEAQIFRPVLQPSETIPQTGNYVYKDREGKTCIKMTMGAEYMIIENKKTWYFNVDPSTVRISGRCGNEEALMSLSLPDNAASLQFKFKQEKQNFYVTKVTAYLSPVPVCKDCSNKNYSGLLAHEKLFKTVNNQSFTCKSETLLQMSSELSIKLVPVQMQAFSLPQGQYGTEVECWADYNKKVIPIISIAVVVCLTLIVAISFLVIRDRRRGGYERI